MEDFTFLLMDQRVTTNTTSLRRINKFKSLVFGGNRSGVVGYGKGDANSQQESYDNAVFNLHQNLIQINLDPLNTFPRPV